MSAPEGNKFASKPAGERAEAQITLRVKTALKKRAVKASRKRNMKLSEWFIEAVEEKCEREKV